MDTIVSQFAQATGVGSGYPIKAKSTGAHTFVASVMGPGAVALVAVLMGSNDLINWVPAATVTVSGTTLAAGSAAVSGDYAYWRFDVSSITGSQATATLSTDPSSAFTGEPLTGERDSTGALTLSGPSVVAVREATGIDYVDDDTIRLQVIPRTGALSSLIGLAGNAGEIGSASDAPVLVLFTGQANEAVTFMASGTRSMTVAGAGNVPMTAQKPNAGLIRITSDAGVNSVTNFGELQEGYVIGQEIRVLNATNQIQTFYHGDATYTTTLGVGYFVVARWDGAAWHPLRVEKLSAPNNGAVGIGTTASTGPRSVSIGQAADASGVNSVAIMGAATALNAVSAGGASAGGEASFACAGGFTYGKYSVSLGGSALWAAQVAGATAAPSSATVYPQWSTALLATRTTSATPRTMTTSGNLPLAADNTLGGAWTGARYFLATIFAHVPGQQKCLVFKRSGVIYKDGTTATIISPVVTEGTDINVGVGGAPAVAIAVGATYQDLSVTVTGVASTTLIWSARIDFTETVA